MIIQPAYQIKLYVREFIIDEDTILIEIALDKPYILGNDLIILSFYFCEEDIVESGMEDDDCIVKLRTDLYNNLDILDIVCYDLSYDDQTHINFGNRLCGLTEEIESMFLKEIKKALIEKCI